MTAAAIVELIPPRPNVKEWEILLGGRMEMETSLRTTF